MFGWVSPLSRVLTPKAGGNTEKVSEQNGSGGACAAGTEECVLTEQF